MAIDQQSEQTNSSNQSEFKTPAQKEKWNKPGRYTQRIKFNEY